VFFCQRDLLVARTRIKLVDELSFADTAHHFVDGRNRVSVSDSKKVQIAIVTCDADTAIFLRHAHNRTRHRIVRRTYQPLVEQVLDLAINLRLDRVGHTVGTHLPWKETVGRPDAMDHRVVSLGSVVEPVDELV